MEEKKIVYYQDELNDDFANNEIKTKQVENNYKYIHKCGWFRFNAFLLRYLFAIPLLWLADTFIFKVKIKNKKVLKSCKKQGYYLYSNHVLPYDPIILPVKTNASKTALIVAGADLFSINKFVSWLVKHFYAIPVPNANKEMIEEYENCLSYHINKKHRVLIYPEAHIWPYYKKIRNYKSSSFKYPAKDNAPIFTATTTFKKIKNNKKPKPIIYIDGPFYPDESLPFKERVEDLRNQAYEAMKYRSENSDNYSYIEYVKKI